MVSQSPAAMTAGGHRSPPVPTAIAPAASQSPRLSASTPPVGTKATSGKGARRALRWASPPSEAGNSFTTCTPQASVAITSLGVSAPDNTTAPVSTMAAASFGSVPGLTRNSAPASTASTACAV